jgi:DUF971 family protein
MTDPSRVRVRPTAIKLHAASRILEIAFDDGTAFRLPCEYLRVHSPSVEVRGLGELQVGKERVNIRRIEPIGSYAVRLYFDDGYKNGVYTWEHLHDLGLNRERYWCEYLERLAKAGHRRDESAAAGQ